MRKYFVFGISILFLTAKSQSIDRFVISTAGDCFKNSLGTVSWTLGELTTETYSQSNAVISQGFQQSYLNVTGLENSFLKSTEVFVYPNPTSQFIKAEIQNPKGEYLISISDVTGKVLVNDKFKTGEFEKQYDLSVFPEGVYLITITSIEIQKSDSYKIVKTK